MSRRRTSYSAGEVRALIEEYPAFRAAADTSPRRRRLDFLVMLADLSRAVDGLEWKYWEVVLLHGLLGIPQTETARLLQVSQASVSKRYRQALEELTYMINGGE